MSTIALRPPKRSRPATARINLRVQPRAKALLQQAARLREQQLTDFMLQAALAAAESALADRTRFTLPADQWRAFNAALDAPPRAIPALRKLFREPSVFKAA